MNFSKAVKGISLADIIAEGGTLSGGILSQDGLTYTAVFTPNDGLEDPQNKSLSKRHLRTQMVFLQ